MRPRILMPLVTERAGVIPIRAASKEPVKSSSNAANLVTAWGFGIVRILTQGSMEELDEI
ncbi:MAG TPA: hypothetical protein VNH18_34430 [Bryobacteraceae bacterium]|nr:hypothetical protein [Bryobacteraceae bacterium]HXJ44435.1 hypothetical protein [Bryobacteraceae bacterium]